MSLQEIIYEARTLSPLEIKQLIAALIELLPDGEAATKPHSITELRELGKELWQGIDAQTYVDQLRNEWDVFAES